MHPPNTNTQHMQKVVDADGDAEVAYSRLGTAPSMCVYQELAPTISFLMSSSSGSAVSSCRGGLHDHAEPVSSVEPKTSTAQHDSSTPVTQKKPWGAASGATRESQ